MENEYPLSTGRSNILGTEAFRNLLAKSLSKAEKEVTILSAYVKVIGVEWLKENLTNENMGNCGQTNVKCQNSRMYA